MRISFKKPIDALRPFILQDINASYQTLISAVQDELTQKIIALSDGQSATWGFFPELKPDLNDYPACVALQKAFDESFLSLPQLQQFTLNLAFIRLAITEPRSDFGGLHVDASAGIDHQPPKNRPPKQDGILRVLINLHTAPRELRYAPNSIESLRQQGIDIPPDHCEIINLPPGIPLKSYAVPPREPDCLHGVMFDSSSTLHAGITNTQGHFLLSYGGYANRTAINVLFH